MSLRSPGMSAVMYGQRDVLMVVHTDAAAAASVRMPDAGVRMEERQTRQGSCVSTADPAIQPSLFVLKGLVAW